jgi:hypothetical protein
MLLKFFVSHSHEAPEVLARLQKGIRVRLAFYERCCHLAEANRPQSLDFGLFDDFAVSFFRLGDGRSYHITTERHICESYQMLYDELAGVCEPVPGKEGPDRSVLQTEADFERWRNSLNLDPPSPIVRAASA